MTGNIYITGQIGTFDDVAGVELIDVIAQVKKQPESNAFNVHINSEGGLVDVGFDIYHYLKSLGKPITTIGSGIVASIATVIFMAGSNRQIYENTRFMIHLPWGGSMGTADELVKFAGQLRTIENKMVGFYTKVLSIQEQAILPLLKNETWLSNKQLSSLGFTTTEQVTAIAKAFINTTTVTEAFTEKDKHWMENLFERVLAKFKHQGALNKIIQDATGAEIDFINLTNDAVIQIGAIATVNGKPANGEYILPDGLTYVFTSGNLNEIIEVSTDDENTVAIHLENKVLKSQLLSIKNEVLALKQQVKSTFNVDGKKLAYNKDSCSDKLDGMKEYLTSTTKK